MNNNTIITKISKGIEKYFEDKCSGKNTARKALTELMEFIREGDTVYIESFSRPARSKFNKLKRKLISL
jgi:DNA invertase Pin-like site-specific DNA recombinase